MKNGTFRNVCNANFDLKFEAEKIASGDGWVLNVWMGDPQHRTWTRNGLEPVGMVLTRCGVMNRVGHKVRLIRVHDCWMSQIEVHRLEGQFERLFGWQVGVDVVSTGKSLCDTERQGLFDLILPSFP